MPPKTDHKKDKKDKPFTLMGLPNYVYPLNLACPTCYAPLLSRSRRDGRCDKCLKSKDVLHVNYRREVKKKKRGDDEDTERYSRRYNRDDD